MSVRPRSVLVVAAALATVLALVLIYRATTPKTTMQGAGVVEGDVLQVGALPVT
jgi:hypothetical protein